MIFMQRVFFDKEWDKFRLSPPELGNEVFQLLTNGSDISELFFREFVFDPYPSDFPNVGEYIFRIGPSDFLCFYNCDFPEKLKSSEKYIIEKSFEVYKQIRIGLSEGINRNKFIDLELYFLQEYSYLSINRLKEKDKVIEHDMKEGMLQLIEYFGIKYDPNKTELEVNPFESDPYQSWDLKL